MRKWIPLVIIAAAFLATAAAYSGLPDRMPTHWNMSGEVDGWTSLPWGAFMLPLMLAAGLAMFYLLPKIDPRGANYSKFKSTYEIVIIATMLFVLGLHLLLLASALGKDVSMTRAVPIGIGVLLVVIGNLLPRTRPNWFIGVRTPWTLSSDRVWERTHRFAGRLFVAAGALVLLTAVVAPRLAHAMLICSTVIIAAAVLGYSYIIWKRDPGTRKVPGPGVPDR